MLCKFLQTIYGKDTRSAQIINVMLSGSWALLLWLHSSDFVLLNIPSIINQGVVDTLIMALLSTVFGVMGLVTKGQRHQVLKFFGLSLGALFFGILANGYFSAYPPLDMMLVICLSLVVWFVGGLLYIVRCEGIDGKFTAKY